MKIELIKARALIKEFLIKWGFPVDDVVIILDNMSDAELAGKKSHGFTSIFWYKDVVNGKYGPLNISGASPSISRETSSSLVINGNEKTGYVVMDFALKKALAKAQNSGIIATSLTKTAPTIGYIGQWCKQVTDKGFVFMAFSNASGSTAPFGATKKVFGTNPIAFGFPTNDVSVIVDMATASTTYANLMRAKILGHNIGVTVGLDAAGNESSDADAIFAGGSLIPFGGYKGSALSFAVELLAGALTGSKTGSNGISYWGTFFLVINPELFGEKSEFYDRVEALRSEIKSANKRPGVEEIFTPGERSLKMLEENKSAVEIDIDDNFLTRLAGLS